MELSHDDVLEILELLENSKVEYLEIEVGSTKLVANKSGITLGVASEPQVVIEPQKAPVIQIPQPQTPPAAQSTAAPSAQSAAAPSAIEPSKESQGADLVKVTAPVVGVFYRQSEPGAPPYVEVGSKVEEGATLGLLEVMKMFTSVTAPIRGEIVEILAQNNEFVEFEQTLMLIRPEITA